MNFNVVLAGCGEVGMALSFILKRPELSGSIQVQVQDPDQGHIVESAETDVLLICFPYSNDFIALVKDYQFRYKPKATIVFSSVPIGTCSQLPETVHSPVEGRHDRMAEYMRRHPRWVGGNNQLAIEFLSKAFYAVYPVQKAEFTEALKLLSTTVYGINIEWARYCGLLVEQMGMDKKLLQKYTDDYNCLTREMGAKGCQRYNLIPPDKDEVIGGHCVLPNAAILLTQAYHPFIESLLMINAVIKDGGLPDEKDMPDEGTPRQKQNQRPRQKQNQRYRKLLYGLIGL